MTRALKLPVQVDLRPIITPALGTVHDGFKQCIPLFWRFLGFRRGGHVPSKVRFKEFHYSSKRGPNGHAMWSFLRDVVALPESLIHSIGILAGPDLEGKIRSLRVAPERWQGVFPLPEESDQIRKVTGIPDKEGKTRVIAILDYFSQTSLKPFHEFLFGLLRKIPQDCTFDQGCFVDGFRKWSNPYYYSVDLTAATDRFPIDLIVQVLEGRFPKE